MARELNDVLKDFEAVEANLVKLERIWNEMRPYLGSANSNYFNPEHEAAYDERARTFRHIAVVMPAIDGYRLEFEIDTYSDVFMGHVDANEVGDVDSLVCQAQHAARQGDILAEYRFRLNIKRRALARMTVQEICDRIETLLVRLSQETTDFAPNKAMPPELWDELRDSVNAIDALFGSSVERGGRWGMLNRHLHFGMKCDFLDIVNHDWPSVQEWITRTLYGPDDALTVAVDDLSELVAAKPTGTVATRLKWESLSVSDFERLIFNLITGTAGYESAQWLTHTNAPDKGRDLSVDRIHRDALAGTRRFRTVIACKHWLSKGVPLGEVTNLRDQMRLWEPPRVDVLIVATSGRFTTDAVDWAERHNQSDQAIRIELWPESHLETLLAQRPDLIAEFSLR